MQFSLIKPSHSCSICLSALLFRIRLKVSKCVSNSFALKPSRNEVMPRQIKNSTNKEHVFKWNILLGNQQWAEEQKCSCGSSNCCSTSQPILLSVRKSPKKQTATHFKTLSLVLPYNVSILATSMSTIPKLVPGSSFSREKNPGWVKSCGTQILGGKQNKRSCWFILMKVKHFPLYT